MTRQFCRGRPIGLNRAEGTGLALTHVLTHLYFVGYSPKALSKTWSRFLFRPSGSSFWNKTNKVISLPADCNTPWLSLPGSSLQPLPFKCCSSAFHSFVSVMLPSFPASWAPSLFIVPDSFFQLLLTFKVLSQFGTPHKRPLCYAGALISSRRSPLLTNRQALLLDRMLVSP